MIADWCGVALLIATTWQMYFAVDTPLQVLALITGMAGVIASFADREADRRLPLSIPIYAGVLLTITAFNHWPAEALTIVERADRLFEPSVFAAVMVVFLYGAAHLLRTPQRMAIMVSFMTVCVLVLAVEIMFDRASTGFVYERAGAESTPSVPNWGGIHGASLFLTLTLPLVLAAPMVVPNNLTLWAASAILGGGLLLAGYLNGSRGGLLAMTVAAFAMPLIVLAPKSLRARLVYWGAILASFTALVAFFIVWRRQHVGFEFLSFRDFAWKSAVDIFREHPWFGIGPGNYANAILSRGGAPDLQFVNAHNLFLQTAAETGVFGLLSLIAFLFGMFRASWSAWSTRRAPILSLGLLAAFLGFLAHSMTENFWMARIQVERTRLLVWLTFALILALSRLPYSAPRGD
jgi:hypothetical protein